MQPHLLPSSILQKRLMSRPKMKVVVQLVSRLILLRMLAKRVK